MLLHGLELTLIGEWLLLGLPTHPTAVNLFYLWAMVRTSLLYCDGTAAATSDAALGVRMARQSPPTRTPGTKSTRRNQIEKNPVTGTNCTRHARMAVPGVVHTRPYGLAPPSCACRVCSDALATRCPVVAQRMFLRTRPVVAPHVHCAMSGTIPAYHTRICTGEAMSGTNFGHAPTSDAMADLGVAKTAS
eukprot:3570930-Rhodomonas_salina.2